MGYARVCVCMCPQVFQGCAALRTLTLNNNKLTSLPVTVGRLSKLQVLNVEQNQLSHVPDEIGKCTALVELHAGECHCHALYMLAVRLWMAMRVT